MADCEFTASTSKGWVHILYIQSCLLSCFTWETPALEVHLPISPNLLFWEKVSWFAKDAGLGRWGDCRNVILGIFCYKFSYLANKLCGTM